MVLGAQHRAVEQRRDVSAAKLEHGPVEKRSGLDPFPCYHVIPLHRDLCRQVYRAVAFAMAAHADEKSSRAIDTAVAKERLRFFTGAQVMARGENPDLKFARGAVECLEDCRLRGADASPGPAIASRIIAAATTPPTREHVLLSLPRITGLHQQVLSASKA